MSAFLLVKSSELAQSAIDKAREKFRKKSFELKEVVLHLGDYQLYFYQNLFGHEDHIYQSENGDSYIVAGTLIYKTYVGESALKEIEKSLNRGEKVENMMFSGSYILIFYRNGELMISRDLFGGLGCFTDVSKKWITTNFLSAVALNGENKFLKNELIEFILFEFCFGYETFIKGIYLLESAKVFNLSRNISCRKKIHIPAIETDPKKCLRNTLDVLVHEFDGYAKTFDGKIVSALSGGYDSRLMLALIVEAGVAPDLYVYGKDSDKDVLVAKDISAGEGYSLQHIDRSKFPFIELSDFESVVNSNYYDLDMQTNVFANRADFLTRLMRAERGGLLLNGSGGEIYRDRWSWNFKAASLYDIFRNLYDIGRMEDLNIRKEDFFSNIEQKMTYMLSQFLDIGDTVTRQEAETIFPIYRSTFYYPTNTLNNYFGNSAYPFMSQPVVLQSFSIPHELKRHGEYERQLIKKLNPKIASYMSSYGFDFAKGPSLQRKVVERLYALFPPRIKTKIKSMSTKSKKSLFNLPPSTNAYTSSEYLARLINPSKMKITSYVGDPAKITNSKVLERIYTLEYFSHKNKIE